MYHLIFLLKGIAVGLAIAAPVGPVGVLCVRRSLNAGALVGLVSGLGAAAADGIYGAVAGFGLASVSVILMEYQLLIRALGGVALLAIGLRILLLGPPDPVDRTVGGGLLGAFASCLLLTLANPASILAFLAIFAGLGLAERAWDYAGAAMLVAGVFLGASCWWLALSGSVALLRSRLGPMTLRRMNRLSGVLILLFGGGTLVSLAVI